MGIGVNGLCYRLVTMIVEILKAVTTFCLRSNASRVIFSFVVFPERKACIRGEKVLR